MKMFLIGSLMLFLSSVSAPTQKIDNQKSKVTFSIGNMGGVNTVKGSIKGMKGSVKFNTKDLGSSSFNVTINPATINTGNKQRDKHLRNEDFFHVEKYKTIRFKSSSISKKGKGYVAKGKLTMHGVTKTVELPFSKSKKNGKTTLQGSISLNRFDYKLGKSVNTFMVGKTAKITIYCVLD